MDIEIDKITFKTQDEIIAHFFDESQKEISIKPLGDYNDFLNLKTPDFYKKEKIQKDESNKKLNEQ